MALTIFAADVLNACRSAGATVPGRPSPIAAPSMRDDGHGDRGGAGKEGLAGALRLLRRERPLLEANAKPAARSSMSAARVTPCRIASSACRVTRAPSGVTIQALVDAPSVTKPARSTNQASNAPASRADCLASTFGSSCSDLMSGCAQRCLRERDHGDSRRGSRLAGCRIERAGDDDQTRFRPVWREAVIAPGCAATDLQIDEAVAHAVPPNDLAHDEPQRRFADRPGDAQRGERAPKTREVARPLRSARRR